MRDIWLISDTHFGHIHQNPSPTPMHKCVCVEQIDYTPIHIEDVRDGRKVRG